MSETPPVGPAPRAPKPSARRIVSRRVGVAIAAVTALVVLAVGAALSPSPRQPPPDSLPLEPAPAVPPPRTEPAAPPDVTIPVTPRADGGAQGDTAPERDASSFDAPRDGAAGDGKPDSDRPATERGSQKKRATEKSTAASSGPGASSARPAENASLPPSDGSLPIEPTDSSKEASIDCGLSDKDMAREAWRRNWPALCAIASGSKAFILIPVKGSLEGAIHETRDNPSREARVVLPLKSESQLTLKQYKVNRLGIKDLRIGKLDDGRIRLRLKLLPGGGDPTYDIKDGYAKITITTPGAN